MQWYDLIAPIYDRAVKRTYQPFRIEAVRALELELGLSVLDLGCGSGLNFKLILDRIGSEGTLIGVDISAGMLTKAAESIEQNGWRNVYLLNRDVSHLQAGDLANLPDNHSRIQRIICTLGLSVFPDWEQAFQRSFELLEHGGKYVIMDLYNDSNGLQSRIVNLIAGSDISRKIWKPLSQVSEQFVEGWHPINHGGEVVVAAGVKRSAEMRSA